MADFEVLEPAIDPNNRISFLLDWELTMKCNLDCSYCAPGLYSGHDNSTKHPPKKECLNTIDFMYRYVDMYMKGKPNGLKYVILNVYGGESLHHPDIVEILKKSIETYRAQYAELWHLTVTTTTNAIVSAKKMDQIIPCIDEFTCSYHTETTQKNKELFKQNVLKIIAAGKRCKVIILMHPEDERWGDAQEMISWCQQNNVKYLTRQLDQPVSSTKFNYTEQQVHWFKSFYQTKNYKTEMNVELKQVDDKINLADSGRACCGGRQLCKDTNLKSRHFFVENRFPDWYCSVNEFFLYIKQVTKEVFVNKDCKMNFEGSVGPIGHLWDTDRLLTDTQKQLTEGQRPIIQCKKNRCVCGLCAPKAKHFNGFESIMRKYRK